MRAIFVFLLLLSILSYGGCPLEEAVRLNETVSPVAMINYSQTSTNSSIIPTRTFHYQLQTAEYDLLKGLNVSFFVVDPEDALLTSAQISDLKEGSRVVLSYLSIGEAENYREYWQADWRVGSPQFIDEENPDWEGNFKVQYWDPEWQGIILARTKDIAELGYDGVYLDIIDAYYYYEEKGRESAAEEMVEFVKEIKVAGREINPEFMVFSQNSPELYEFKDYKAAIDGLGKEDTWYLGDEFQDVDETDYVLSFMRKAEDEGKRILVIDYPSDPMSICDFYKKCFSEGFYCTVSNRELDLDEPILCSG